MNKLRYIVFKLICMLCVMFISAFISHTIHAEDTSPAITIMTEQSDQDIWHQPIKRITVVVDKRHVNFVPKEDVTMIDMIQKTLKPKDVIVMKNKRVDITTLDDLYQLLDTDMFSLEFYSVKRHKKPIHTKVTTKEWQSMKQAQE